MCEAPYVHALNGRVRIKLAAIKRAPDKAREAEVSLHSLPGVSRVKANPITGNALIHYDSRHIGHADILEAVRRLGYLTPPPPETPRPIPPNVDQYVDGFHDAVTQMVVRSTMEFALARLFRVVI